MKKIAAGMMIVLAFAAIVCAQTAITGRWQGETQSRKQVVLDLNVSKDALTGTLTYDGQSSRITEGKLSKTTFTFKAMLDGQIEGFSGEPTGDEVTFWPDRMGRDRAVILKRVKN